MDTNLALAERLRGAIERAVARMRAIPEDASARPPAPGKWSPRELVGHLLDSACNNHGRFVRAQLDDGLVHPGYDQDAWVRVQAPNAAPWGELVELFRLYNLHLARVVEAADPGALNRTRRRHNLHEIGFATPAFDAPVTLAGFVADYVDHLEHHVAALPGGDG
jgi:hypothetical protein